MFVRDWGSNPQPTALKAECYYLSGASRELLYTIWLEFIRFQYNYIIVHYRAKISKNNQTRKSSTIEKLIFYP